MPLRQAIAPIPERTNKAQSTLEYAVIIACVAAALIAMQIYMKRGVSGRLRQVSDDIGSQYEPTDTTGEMTKTVVRNVTQNYESYKNITTGKTISKKTETINNETTQEWGYEEVGAWPTPPTPPTPAGRSLEVLLSLANTSMSSDFTEGELKAIGDYYGQHPEDLPGELLQTSALANILGIVQPFNDPTISYAGYHRGAVAEILVRNPISWYTLSYLTQEEIWGFEPANYESQETLQRIRNHFLPDGELDRSLLPEALTPGSVIAVAVFNNGLNTTLNPETNMAAYYDYALGWFHKKLVE